MLYTHCFGHALNLAVQDSIKSIKCLSQAFNAALEIFKLVKKMPQGNTKLDTLRASARKRKVQIHST